MTEQNFSTQTRYEMALLARLQQFEVSHAEPGQYDTESISAIAEYLIDIEELGSQFDSSEGEQVVDIGMFIYGFLQRGE